jgi:hypothetical protein
MQRQNFNSESHSGAPGTALHHVGPGGGAKDAAGRLNAHNALNAHPPQRKSGHSGRPPKASTRSLWASEAGTRYTRWRIDLVQRNAGV